MNNPLLSCRIKIDRAREHLFYLNKAIEGLPALATHEAFTQHDLNEFTREYRLANIKGLPPHFGTFIGDAIHNLCSALDSLAVALVKREGHTDEGILRSTYFPIKEEGPKSNSADDKFFERIGPKAAEIVKRIEPYPGGKGETLCDLRYLNRIDKHRTIIPVMTVFGYGSFISSDVGGTFTEAERKPIKNGDLIGTWVSKIPNHRPHAEFTFLIALSDVPGASRRGVYSFLENCINLIESTTKIFGQQIFGLWNF
jgi:hypothetical protein